MNDYKYLSIDEQKNHLQQRIKLAEKDHYECKISLRTAEGNKDRNSITNLVAKLRELESKISVLSAELDSLTNTNHGTQCTR